jgi:hypothetical protein
VRQRQRERKGNMNNVGNWISNEFNLLFRSQKWFVFRRYAQFDELDKRLKKKGLLPVTDNTFVSKWQKMKLKGTNST